MKRLLLGILAALALTGLAAAPASADRYYDRYDRGYGGGYYDRYDRYDRGYDRGYYGGGYRSSRYYDPYCHDGYYGGSRVYVRDRYYRPRRRSSVRFHLGIRL